ncbi:hypothetical protein NHP164001_03100 [Helicobacter trogontum]|uniref:Uncharacterized protein n=1 Tax=Helicobacter trogontum TaxID=50960 RepID=A0ABQ0D1V1_9HELI
MNISIKPVSLGIKNHVIYINIVGYAIYQSSYYIGGMASKIYLSYKPYICVHINNKTSTGSTR